MDIEIVMKRLHDTEINCCVSSVWDSGSDMRLGDETNGFAATGNFRTLDEFAEFLVEWIEFDEDDLHSCLSQGVGSEEMVGRP